MLLKSFSLTNLQRAGEPETHNYSCSFTYNQLKSILKVNLKSLYDKFYWNEIDVIYDGGEVSVNKTNTNLFLDVVKGKTNLYDLFLNKNGRF